MVRVESQLDFSDEEDVNEVASEDVFLGIKEANKALGSLIREYKPFEKDVMKKTITQQMYTVNSILILVI